MKSIVRNVLCFDHIVPRSKEYTMRSLVISRDIETDL